MFSGAKVGDCLIFIIVISCFEMESLVNILPYIQIVLSVLLVIGILMQQSDATLGSVFGGGNDAGGMQHTRRGFEKILFNGSIIIAILFIITALLSLTL